MKKFISFIALLGSTTTLVCCVLPAIFVIFGFGAIFATIVGAVPQITWLSEHKVFVFGGAALLVGLAIFFSGGQDMPAVPLILSWQRHVRRLAEFRGISYSYRLAFIVLGPSLQSSPQYFFPSRVRARLNKDLTLKVHFMNTDYYGVFMQFVHKGTLHIAQLAIKVLPHE